MEKKPSRLRGYLLFQRARIASTFNLILVAGNYSLFEYFFFFLSIRHACDTRRFTPNYLIRYCYNINVRVKLQFRRNGARSEVIVPSHRLKLVK